MQVKQITHVVGSMAEMLAQVMKQSEALEVVNETLRFEIAQQQEENRCLREELNHMLLISGVEGFRNRKEPVFKE